MNTLARILIVVVLIAIGATMALPVAAAQSPPDPEWNFISIIDVSQCPYDNGNGIVAGRVMLETVDIEGNGMFWYDIIAEANGLIYMDFYRGTNTGVDSVGSQGIVDLNDRGQQTASFIDIIPGSTVNVTMRLWWETDSGLVLEDEETFSFVCGEGIPPVIDEPDPGTLTAAQPPVPGCDARLDLPSNAVVGAFVADAHAYYAPGYLTFPPVLIPAANTAWVLGQDDTGQYYKIIWACQHLWVPVEAMGPNHDAVWQGAPLPVSVAQ